MRLLLISIFVVFLVVLLTPNAFAVQYPVLIHNGVADNREMNFSPSEIEIDQGDTVRWKVLELNTVHTVTFASLDIDRELVQWQCSEIGECSSIQEAAFSYTFEELGTYNYKCKMHSWMNGVVKVTELGSEAEVSVGGDGGVMFIDKLQYTVTETERANITIYGKVNDPGSGDKPLFTITNPDGSIEEQTGVIKHDGEYRLDLYVTYEETGTYNVHATFGLEDMGTAKFDVVKRPNPTIENPFTPSDDESTDIIGSSPNSQENIITVTTDFQSYNKGDMIKISGITPYLSSEQSQLTIQILDPRNNIVTVSQLRPNNDRTYSLSINSEGPMWKLDGNYTVKANFANENVATMFFFSVAGFPPEQVYGYYSPTILKLDPICPSCGSDNQFIVARESSP
jgi:plastocyanin